MGSSNTSSAILLTGGVSQLSVANAALNLVGPNYTSSTGGVCVTANATTCGATSSSIVLLDLNQSTLQGAETSGDCSTTVNAGGIYYRVTWLY